MIKRFFVFSFLIVFSIVLNAQSVFSFYGPAEIANNRDAHGEGMGDTGAGDLFRTNTSFINPALSTTINKTYFTTALSMGNIYYKDNTGKSFRDDQAFLPYFNIVVPHKQHRFGFAYNNISSGKLNTETASIITYDNKDFDIIEEQKIDFSLYKASIFYANKNKVLNFGAGISYIFGHKILYYKQDFLDSDFSDARFEKEQTFKNPTLNFGVAKSFSNVSAGLSLSLPVELKGDSYFKTNTLNKSEEKSDYNYPANISFGLTWKASELFAVSSDFDYEMWEDTDNFENSVNSLRAGLGLSWAGISNSKNFFARIPLRAGISHKNLPFEISGNTINELAYHFGLSFPLKQYDSYLDFAVKLYSRGDSTKHNYEENGFLITIGTHGFDFLRKPANRKAPRDIPKPDQGGF